MTTANDTSSALERLGFIGLGNMGGAIALRLLRAGYPLTVLDLDDEKMQALKKNGAAVAATPKEIAERSTIVLASLQPGDVEKVTCGENGIAEANNEKLVFVDLSSTAPELAIKVSDSLRARGIEMLDAPLSGADIGATNGNLTIFVGGSYEAYQRCLPVLQHVGRMVTYLGKNGNGQIGKQINQVMQALSELAIYEGLLLAKKSGLDLKMFARAASAGCAQSWRLDELVDNVFQQGRHDVQTRHASGPYGPRAQNGREARTPSCGSEGRRSNFLAPGLASGNRFSERRHSRSRVGELPIRLK